MAAPTNIDKARAVARDAAAFIKFDPFKDSPFWGAPNSDSEAAAANVLPITGQGVISIRTKATAGLRFTVDGGEKTSLILYITNDCCDLYSGDTGKEPVPPTDYTRIPYVALKDTSATYLEANAETMYWLSMDNDNGVLRYGKYYLSGAETVIQAILKIETKDGIMEWIDPKYKWLDGLSTFSLTQDGGETSLVHNIHVSRLPIVRDLSPYVVLDQLSLLDLEKGTFTIPANLPPACQALYQNVGSPNIVLNTPDFPDFSAAIQHSVSTEGCVGYKLLQAKASEFGWEGTYLRITLGLSMGNSPGVPYVLEIWPVGHCSPIHDHGDSFAVIKVLHGTIECTYFESLEDGKEPVPLGPKAVLQEPAITWLGENNYQVHQLRNTSQDVCCTIQCYQFGDTNDEHHRYFRYVDQKTEMHQFTPNSDMSFARFRNAIKQEWDARSLKA